MTDNNNEPLLEHQEMTTNYLTAMRIKEERINRNITQQNMADALHMDVSTYSRLENGKIEISIARLEEIAAVYKVPVVVLLPINLHGTININNGNYYCLGNLINNYSDNETQNSMKRVIELLTTLINK